MNTINLGTFPCLFRSIAATVGWANVLTGRGNPSRPPPSNRYNDLAAQSSHPTSYVTPDVRVAIAEAAYYAARELHQRIGRQFQPQQASNLGLSYPLRVLDLHLWCFQLTTPGRLLDLAATPSLAPFQVPPYPPFTLLNPSRRYDATQQIGDAVRRPRQHAGLLAPSVRCALRGPVVVLFHEVAPVVASPLGVWGLEIEFRDPAGQAVTPATVEVDWTQPWYRLTHSAVPGAAAPAALPAGLPAGYRVGHWEQMTVRFA